MTVLEKPASRPLIRADSLLLPLLAMVGLLYRLLLYRPHSFEPVQGRV